MGKLKKYDSSTDTWLTIATGGGGSSGGSGTSFDTNFFATMSGNQNINTNDWTKVTFDTVGTDDNTEWDAANAYWTCKEAGTYLLCAALRYTNNSSGMRQVTARKNTVALTETDAPFWNVGANIATMVRTFAPVVLGVGDDIEIWAYHNSTANPLALIAVGCSWSMHRLK